MGEESAFCDKDKRKYTVLKTLERGVMRRGVIEGDSWEEETNVICEITIY